jgi:hypothetical protein
LLLAAGVLARLWFAGAAANPGPPGFRLDDAWIHLVYGRGLLESGFLAYNPGEPSTGCTSPLWALCLAILHALFHDPRSADGVVRAVILGGSLLHLGVVAAGADLARRITGGDRAAALSAGCLLALAPPLGLAALSGMEVALASLLLLLAVRAFATGAPARSGALLALAALARPESAAVTAVLLALVLLFEPGRKLRAALSILIPSVIAGGLLAAHHLWASGAPLPATFYAKSSFSARELPGRLATCLSAMLPTVPPLAAGVGWIALLGLLRVPERGLPRAALFLPLLAGVAFLLANLSLIEPIDPKAFYHLRYVLPAAPLLLVALAAGAHGLGGRWRGRAALAPQAALVLLALAESLATIGPQSRHFHNDVRNINEVQRRIGEWLAERAEPGTWIAASDAGAIRYFSNLPTIDVIGLNTPQMLSPDEEFLSAHPVRFLAIMPAWFRAEKADRLRAVYAAATENYTVTSDPRMARQVVLEAADAAGPIRVRFAGYRRFELELTPPAPMSGP